MKILLNWKIHIPVWITVAICEFIGPYKVTLGPGVVAFLPMLYAMIICCSLTWPRLKLIKLEDMKMAGQVTGVITFILIAKVGATVGPMVSKLSQCGIALALQELGHFCGTVLLALPVAIFLGMKREAVGATFSIDRETSIALISEKHGLDSPEGRGVISTYICGTLFGAIWVGFLAGFFAALDIFHPYALAMGSAVGSTSMMAAGMGALKLVYPELGDEILMYAGASSFLSTVFGVYMLMFISLPIAEKMYDWLSPIIGPKTVEK